MNWPSTTTRQIHTKDPNLFTKLFGNITHTHASNILAFGGIGSGYLHTDSMQSSCGIQSAKSTFLVKLFSKQF
jgi:hypothetical protein